MKLKKLTFVLFLLVSCKMNEDYNNSKKEISFGGLKICLDVTHDIQNLKMNNPSNLYAMDSVGKVIWTAEVPKTHYSQYYDISIDEAQGLIIAKTGSGYQYLIDIRDGKIKDYYLVK